MEVDLGKWFPNHMGALGIMPHYMKKRHSVPHNNHIVGLVTLRKILKN
jgi:hypothetical protein